MRDLAKSIVAILFAFLALASFTFAAGADSACGWPRTATTAAGDRVTLSALQVDEWRDRTIYAKCAAVVQLKEGSPCTGTVNLRAATALDRSDRTVILTEITLPAMRFDTDAAGIVPIGVALSAAITEAAIRVPLDDLLATMSATAFADPPPESSALPKVTLALERLIPAQVAQFSPLVAQRLDGCVNASAPLFRTDAGVFYLLLGGEWYSSDALESGAWQWVAPSTLPTALRAIPESSQWASALAHVPSTALYREAVQIAAFSPLAVGAELHGSERIELWWNPWDGSWWSNTESAQARTQRTGAVKTGATSASVPSAFLFDGARENLFVGLDGRVYAHRGAQWFRSAAGGAWTELTEHRSTARVLEEFARARTAALARRGAFEKWRSAQSARDLSEPGASSNERLSMKDARPSTTGMRHAAVDRP